MYATTATCLNCAGDGEFCTPDRSFWIMCQHCRGQGECPCDDCINTAAENAFSDQCESEPPLSADERHQIAWQQKQELRRS